MEMDNVIDKVKTYSDDDRNKYSTLWDYAISKGWVRKNNDNVNKLNGSLDSPCGKLRLRYHHKEMGDRVKQFYILYSTGRYEAIEILDFHTPLVAIPNKYHPAILDFYVSIMLDML